MSDNGQVIRGRVETWNHAHNCYTCRTYFHCNWMYCKDQVDRNCAQCIAAMRQEEPTP